MSRTPQPELGEFLGRKMSIEIEGGRRIAGILDGYDPFMNLVIREATDEITARNLGVVVVRGAAVVSFVPLEAVKLP